MWADQVSTSGDPTASIGNQRVKKDAVSEQFGEQTETMAHGGDEDQAREHAISDVFVDTSEAASADLPSTEDSGDALPVPFQESGTSQADESVAPASLAFPTSDSAKQSPSKGTASQSQSGGGVTFEDSANAPPSALHQTRMQNPRESVLLHRTSQDICHDTASGFWLIHSWNKTGWFIHATTATGWF